MTGRPPLSVLFRQVLGIMFLAAVVALVNNAFSPIGLPLIRGKRATLPVADSLLFHDTAGVAVTPAGNSRAVDLPAAGRGTSVTRRDSGKASTDGERAYKVLTLAQMRRLLDGKHALLLDARTPEEFAKGHIAGAKNVSGLEPDLHFEELIRLPRDTVVIIYCTDPECPLGHMLGDFMKVIEFTNIYHYEDGWDGWVKAGLPVVVPGKGE